MESKYSLTTRIIHWSSAALYLSILLTVWLHDAFKFLMPWHKALGVVAMLLVVIRLFFRLTGPTLEPLPSPPPTLVKLGHAALYGLMIAVPLSGILMSMYGRGIDLFFLQVPPLLGVDKAMSGMFKEAHEVLANLFITFVFGHVVFALWHRFGKKDGGLRQNCLRHGLRKGGDPAFFMTILAVLFAFRRSSWS